MSRRFDPYVYPYTAKTIHLTNESLRYDKKGDPLKDKDGNIQYCKKSSCSLAELISRVSQEGIPESEYNNVEIYSSMYDRYSDCYIDCVYKKFKTEDQIKQEKENILKEQEKEKLAKEEKKRIREAKKAEKAKVLSTLTKEQKEALRIKVNTTYPGYAGREEMGGSDF